MAQMELLPLAEAGVEITHHFSHGVYAKQIDIPADRLVFQHTHLFDHMSILASGSVIVTRDKVPTHFTGPAVIDIKAGVPHSIYAVTDSVWFCVHHTYETDPDSIDHTLTVEK